MVCNCFMELCSSRGGMGGLNETVGVPVWNTMWGPAWNRAKLSGRAVSSPDRNGSILMVCREGPTFITLHVGEKKIDRVSEVE